MTGEPRAPNKLPPSLHIQEMAVLLWQDIDIEISLLRLYQAVKLIKGYEADSKELKDTLAKLVEEYVNSTPCWALSGYSVNEI